MTVTAKRLRDVLTYNPDTGEFSWRVARGMQKAGAVAGCVEPTGYWVINIDRKRYYAHRLAWLHVYGEWPTTQLDHVNGCKTDNRWNNLRPATVAQNAFNRKVSSRNKSGLKGVSWNAREQRWQAHISIDGKQRRLGNFRCPTAAYFAYCRAAKAHHGEFARVA